MPTHINDNGTWREIANIYVNDVGTWRQIQEVHVNDAGTWRRVYQNLVVQLVSDAYSRSQNTASFTLFSSGAFHATDGGASALVYSWLTSGNAASVDVRVTPTVGSFSSGTTATWLNLSTSRTWTLNWPGGMASASVQATVELRNASTFDLLASETVTLITTP